MAHTRPLSTSDRENATPSVLTSSNIGSELGRYEALVRAVKAPRRTLEGLELCRVLKREKLGAGPYPKVSLFESANRIMSDLVIFHAVKWLLRKRAFPFRSYHVEFGHGNSAEHDIVARSGGRILVGEVFNVANSYFPAKKGSALKKLRNSNLDAEFRLLICNNDAVASGFKPQPRSGEHFLLVDIDSGDVRIHSGQR